MRKEGTSALYFKKLNRMPQDSNMPVKPEHNNGTVIVRPIRGTVSLAQMNRPCQAQSAQVQ